MMNILRRRGVSLTLLLAIFTLVLAACASQAAPATEAPAAPANTEAPAVVEPPAAAPADPTATTAAAEASSASTGEVSFSKDIMPIFESRCINCHGGQRVSEGLNMKTYDQLIAGSSNGPVLSAGDATNSLMVQLIEQGKMPKRGPKVTPDQLQLIVDWINAGAQNN